jgi:hypothetical protein
MGSIDCHINIVEIIAIISDGIYANPKSNLKLGISK